MLDINDCQLFHLTDDLWKESLNRDGLQFHQYQQNEQLPHNFGPVTVCTYIDILRCLSASAVIHLSHWVL